MTVRFILHAGTMIGIFIVALVGCVRDNDNSSEHDHIHYEVDEERAARVSVVAVEDDSCSVVYLNTGKNVLVVPISPIVTRYYAEAANNVEDPLADGFAAVETLYHPFKRLSFKSMAEFSPPLVSNTVAYVTLLPGEEARITIPLEFTGRRSNNEDNSDVYCTLIMQEISIDASQYPHLLKQLEQASVACRDTVVNVRKRGSDSYVRVSTRMGHMVEGGIKVRCIDATAFKHLLSPYVHSRRQMVL